MKKLLLITCLLFSFSLTPVVVYADETIPQEEINVVEDSIEFSETESSEDSGTTIISETVTEFIDVDTEIELENNELLYQILVTLQYIMYILIFLFFLIWGYIIYIVVKKLVRFFGFGFI